MLKSLAVICLLVQASAADPELEAAVGGSYMNTSDGHGGVGPEMILGAGWPVFRYAVLGLQGSVSELADGSDRHFDLGLLVTTTHHLGPVTVELGFGISRATDGHSSTGRSVLAARVTVGHELRSYRTGALELVGAVERSPVLELGLAEADPASTVFLGIGFRARGHE